MAKRDDKTRDLLRMKTAATALLLAMVALYIGAKLYEPAYPALSFARAFAEAGMAGGIADWFAVTALFRHPLGLPLPHTAIIPRNKDRIGENLGVFFEQNFLSQEVVAAKLADADLAGALLRWLGKPAQIERIVDYFASLVPGLLASIKGEEVEPFIRQAIEARIRQIELTPLVQSLMTQAAQAIDYDEIVTPALEELALLFHENQEVIRGRVREGTGWIWRRISLDEKVADAVVAVIDQALSEVRDNPRHAWRHRFGEYMRERAVGLAMSPAYAAKYEAWRDKLLAHPALSACVSGIWRELVQRTGMDMRAADSIVRAKVHETVSRWAQAALNDDAIRASINARARDAILEMMPSQRRELGQLISDTVRRWDTATVTKKIEVEVGRDLQYVRINGTLIGGLVGLAIHALAALG